MGISFWKVTSPPLLSVGQRGGWCGVRRIFQYSMKADRKYGVLGKKNVPFSWHVDRKCQTALCLWASNELTGLLFGVSVLLLLLLRDSVS